MAILRNSLIVSFWTLASRFLGFARDLLIANKLGAGMASDTFFIALQLPNLLRRLFGEGAFNVAFIPLLAKEKAKSLEAAQEYAGAALSWLLVIVTGVVIAGVAFMPALVAVMVSGWRDDPERMALAVELGRITFPYLGFITIAAFFGALCNTWGKFAAYAMVPALLNLSILICLLGLPQLGLSAVEAAAWSVPLGGVAQAVYMFWAVRKLGIRLRLGILPKHKGLKPLLMRMGPATLGVGVLQLALMIDNNVASYIEGVAAISYLNYANRFYQMPLALIGIAVATVLLPQLAVMLHEGKRAEASKTFSEALNGCLTLAVGATVGLMALSYPLIATFFRHGEFSDMAAWATAWAMIGYVVGLPGYILTKVTAPAFFANEDPMTPLKASIAALIVNFVCNVLFVVAATRYGWTEYAHIGIAASTALGGYVNAGLQAYWLRKRRMLAVDFGALFYAFGRMLAVGAAMGVAFGIYQLVIPFGGLEHLVLRLLWLGGAMALMGGVFAVGVEWLGLLTLRDFIRQMKAGRGKKVKLAGDSAAE